MMVILTKKTRRLPSPVMGEKFFGTRASSIITEEAGRENPCRKTRLVPKLQTWQPEEKKTPDIRKKIRLHGLSP